MGEMGMRVSKTGAPALKDSSSRCENSLPTSKNTEPASQTIGRASKNSKRPTKSNDRRSISSVRRAKNRELLDENGEEDGKNSLTLNRVLPEFDRSASLLSVIGMLTELRGELDAARDRHRKSRVLPSTRKFLERIERAVQRSRPLCLV